MQVDKKLRLEKLEIELKTQKEMALNGQEVSFNDKNFFGISDSQMKNPNNEFLDESTETEFKSSYKSKSSRRTK